MLAGAEPLRMLRKVRIAWIVDRPQAYGRLKSRHSRHQLIFDNTELLVCLCYSLTAALPER